MKSKIENNPDNHIRDSEKSFDERCLFGDRKSQINNLDSVVIHRDSSHDDDYNSNDGFATPPRNATSSNTSINCPESFDNENLFSNIEKQ